MDRHLAAERQELDLHAAPLVDRELPLARLEPPVVLDAALVLIDEHVFGERVEAPVVGELRPAIVGFGRLREDFHEHDRVEQRVPILRVKARPPQTTVTSG